MKKRVILLLSSIFCISMLSYGIDAWIRINQLGYLPNAQKKAILISESTQQIKQFTICDALTNEELESFNSITSKGDFQSFKSTFILDFSQFKTQGAFYIKAGLIYSPTIFINKNTYLGTADFLLNYMRQQRSVLNASNSNPNQYNTYESMGEEATPSTPKFSETDNLTKNKPTTNKTTKPTTVKSQKKLDDYKTTEQPAPKFVNIMGGWHNGADYIQYGSTTANAIYQMLFAYQINPSAFNDAYDTEGKPGTNGIPDILDEAKWGLDWLLKMYPSKDILYHQIADDREQNPLQLLSKDNADYGSGQGNGRPAYLATGKPQGLFTIKNHTTGIASIAGKYSSAFGLGAEIFAKFNPTFADSLKQKALVVYELGKKHPGVCQSVPAKSKQLYEEDDWADDMELAAAQLYRITYEANYLKEAAAYGRMEPITPWMCSDTANHYQWYPFINLGHFMLANVENPRYQKEFILNLQNGLQRMQNYANANPFNIGVPLIRCSNNLVTALASQCLLYRSLTNDTTFIDMETALTDWLFGKNPWGTSMITQLPKIGHSPTAPYSSLSKNKHIQVSGGLVNGPVQRATYKNLKNNQLLSNNSYERFQSDWSVYHDDSNDYATNEPTMDGTASLTFLLSNKQKDGVQTKTADKNQYTYGGITRTDTNKKQISLVFSGHENADGYKTIRKVLKKLNIKASFFFTGDFYRKGRFKSIIKGLQKDNHYLGAHSDKNLLYCSWIKKDSLLVTKSHFLSDLKGNYEEMQKFGISKNQAPFFLPANEWYNDSISLWSKEVGLQLINYTSGTLSYTDESTPEMRERYFSSNEIFNKIKQVEASQTLNGHILLFHIGSDKRRQDKFYPKLYALLIELSKAGYNFVDLFQATDIIGKNEQLTDKKQKRKN